LKIMAASLRGPAEECDYTVPSGGLTSGQLVNHAGRTWILQGLKNRVEGEQASLLRGIVVEIDKATASDVFNVGDRVGYDISALSAVLAGNVNQDFLVYGTVREASASGRTTVKVALDDSGEPTVNHVRRRFTIAEVNAGATLLPAIAGRAYRMIDSAMIAIGGAAATATSVDLRGTQAASSVNLVANAVAGLTQNTLLRAGATNAAILAGGVSFVANDVNTAITVGRTGSALATATHIDVLLTYAID
jgi:hypothetical protein